MENLKQTKIFPVIAAAILAVLISACVSGGNDPTPGQTPEAASSPDETARNAAAEFDRAPLDSAVSAAAVYMLNTVTRPQVGWVGGEWAILGLGRSGYDVPPSYFEGYYTAVSEYAAERGGILHGSGNGEYSRVILGLTAAGYDPRDVAGFDLTAPLEDFTDTMRQGVNGAVFALLALDSNNYPNSRRDDYVAEILRRQLDDGGWSLTGDIGDPDITGMALQALAKYRQKAEVRDAIDGALSYLSARQNADGGYTSWGSESSGSPVQVLVALCELGIPMDDPRFVKNGVTLLDCILGFQNADGGFSNTREGGGNNQMSTEQAFYGLVAAQRILDGRFSLYRMNNSGLFPVTLTVRADTLLDNMNLLNKEKRELVPADGVIFPVTAVTASEGESVFDILQREMRNAGIHMAFQNTPFYGSAYVKAIRNIYEFDAGELSGWQYSVNGLFSSTGASLRLLQPGDAVEWHYTCDLGRDLGQDQLIAGGG
jgi:hypothetical protein